MTLIVGYLLDIIFGDPFKFHPVILIGKLISFFEKVLYKNNYARGGILFLLVQFTVITPIILFKMFAPNNAIIIIEIYIYYSMLATKSLHVETKKVMVSLEENNMEQARKEISFLVSRDTDNLDSEKIYKALAETVSENTIDGIVAPLIFAAIGVFFNLGIEFLLFYKITNTLDSMVGYKNERYYKFGFFSAKIDDILNFIPSRVGSLIMLIPGLFVGNVVSGVKYFLKDRLNSTSPNAGHSESMIAGLLQIELLGPSNYHGEIINKASIGIDKNKINKNIINKIYFIMFCTSLITILIFGGIFYAIF